MCARRVDGGASRPRALYRARPPFCIAALLRALRQADQRVERALYYFFYYDYYYGYYYTATIYTILLLRLLLLLLLKVLEAMLTQRHSRGMQLKQGKWLGAPLRRRRVLARGPLCAALHFFAARHLRDSHGPSRRRGRVVSPEFDTWGEAGKSKRNLNGIPGNPNEI